MMSNQEIIIATSDVLFGKVYELVNDCLKIKKKNGEIIKEHHLNNVTVLYFNEVNMFGRGQLILYLNNINKSITISFTKKEQENFKCLFNKLTENKSFKNMSVIKAAYFKNEDIESLKKESNKLGNKLVSLFSGTSKKIKFKEIKEYKCTCSKCNHIWYFDDKDKSKETGAKQFTLGSMLLGNLNTGAILSSISKENERCPSCGSRVVNIEEIISVIEIPK